MPLLSTRGARAEESGRKILKQEDTMKDSIYEITIEGTRPYIMHNGRLADQLDPHTKALKVLARAKDKSDEDHIKIARTEFLGSLYWDEKLGPYIPSDNLQAVIERGATRRKLGKVFKASVGIQMPLDAEGFALKYKGPRDLEGLWADDAFVFTKGVKRNGRRVTCARPRFGVGWSCTFIVEVMLGGVTKSQLEQALQDAGTYEGIGDWRPRYGRFTVASCKEV
jgi:hypothetical protein